jgi:MoxR-vWA-beta-propeller ternary system domain bpX4
MSDLADFLADLFQEGRITFRRPPAAAASTAPEVTGLLERAYAAYRLDIGGAAIALEAGVACAAAELVQQASWALVCRHDRVEDLQKRLRMPRAPATAADHLSADLLLRYLPQVHRRARAFDPSDALVALIERVLRQWPLSGVLARLDEGPTSPLDFCGHEGLMLLYAERFAEREPPASPWRPEGRLLEYVELVSAGRRDRP